MLLLPLCFASLVPFAPAQQEAAPVVLEIVRPAELGKELQHGILAQHLLKSPAWQELEAQPQAAAVKMGAGILLSPVKGDVGAFLDAFAGEGLRVTLRGQEPSVEWALHARGRDGDLAEACLRPVLGLAGVSPQQIAGEEWTIELGEIRFGRRGDDFLAGPRSTATLQRVGDEALPAGLRIARAAEEAQQVAVRMAEAVGKIPAGPGYPQTTLARRLQLAARLARVEAGPPVLCVQLGGFDTHSLQPGSHAALLRQLGDALAAFHADLARDGVAERCLTLVYSEFGRRVRENGSAGTDHGTAGPVFALGGKLKGGVYGESPRLDRPDGNLAVQHDFRAVFSEAVRDWLGWDARGLFDGGFEHGRGKLGYLRG